MQPLRPLMEQGTVAQMPAGIRNAHFGFVLGQVNHQLAGQAGVGVDGERRGDFQEGGGSGGVL